MSEFHPVTTLSPRDVAAVDGCTRADACAGKAGVVSSESVREMAQKQHTLAEFSRRNMLAQLRATLHPLVKDWWWARDETLSAIHECFGASGTHCVIDKFMGEEASRSVRTEIFRAHSMHMLDAPGVLGGGERGVASQSFLDRQVRSDTLGWFDCTARPSKSAVDMACRFGTADVPLLAGDSHAAAAAAAAAAEEESWPHLQALLARIETLVVELGAHNSNDISDRLGGKEEHAYIAGTRRNEFSTCSTRSRCMVTCYPGQDGDESKYTRHFDNANGNGRRVTCIYYVNEGWKRAHGGALRLYSSSDASALITDVEPIADRLVLFYSDMRVLHEVLPTHRDRFAVSLWFFDKVERAKALAANAATAATAASAASAATSANAVAAAADSKA